MTAVDEGIAFEDPRKVLARSGLHPKKSFSQNFLIAESVVDKIAEVAVPTPGGFVVELGPGLGTLTAGLLRRGARVHAVERDRDMIATLAKVLPHPRLEVVSGDAATVSLAALATREGGPVALAGNLPYAITGAIFRHLVSEREHLAHAVVMVQKEVRDRLLAPAGTKAYGALTIFTRCSFDISHVLLVSPGSFYPAPKVSSAVVKLTPLAAPRAIETETFQKVVRALFDQRRKTSRNALLSVFKDAERVDRALADAGVEARMRGETFEIETIDAIAKSLEASAESTTIQGTSD
jgi:16S rRNA (adenine1518-N6/adenine1519-N6)-dimethyltransferase